MSEHSDNDLLKELIRYADPWDNFRTDLRCGESSKDMVHASRRIAAVDVPALQATLATVTKEAQKLREALHVRCDCLESFASECTMSECDYRSSCLPTDKEGE